MTRRMTRNIFTRVALSGILAFGAVGFLTVAVMLPQSAMAKTEKGDGEVLVVRDEADEIEIRVRNYLNDYLHEDEFMVFVSYNFAAARGAVKAMSSDIGLPGLPGIDKESSVEIGGPYFDLDDNLHKRGTSNRPPIVVNVVLGKTVGPEKVRLLRRVLPLVARLDKGRGDNFRLSSGDLKKEFAPDPTGQNWVETVFRHKREVFSLIFGLAGALCLVVLLNGVLSFFGGRRANASRGGADAGNAPAGPQVAAPQAAPENKTEEQKKRGLSREDLYSNDHQFLETVKDVVEVARQYPARVAYLITDWIQQGGISVRNASVLLNNFDLRASEGVLQKLVPSDIDRLKIYLDTKFDPFTEDNVRVIYQARLDLMKITSHFARQSQRQTELAFLGELEDDMLAEVLKGQNPRMLAFICSQIPIHRIMPYISKFRPTEDAEFFKAICNMDKVNIAEREKMTEVLKARMQESLHLSFTKSSKVATLSKIVRNLPTPSRQERVLKEISKIAPSVNDEIRDQIFIFEDIMSLPPKLLQSLCMEEDPAVLARAFCRMGVELQETLQGFLPQASREIFVSEISALHRIRPGDIERAKARMVLRLEQLIDQKVIDIHEVRAEKDAAEDEGMGDGLKVAG